MIGGENEVVRRGKIIAVNVLKVRRKRSGELGGWERINMVGIDGVFSRLVTGKSMPIDFGPGIDQVEDMKNAPGVQKARDAFYAKNSGLKCEYRQPLTNYKATFGLGGLWSAGLNSTQQFVGSYRADIRQNNSETILIDLTNSTSFTSFSYGVGPGWNGGFGGTQTQYYHWTELL